MVPSSPANSPTASTPEVSPERAAALGRLQYLLDSARPVDIPVVASALSEAELAAVVEASRGRLSAPLREYVLVHGPSRALVALARQVLLHGDRDRYTMERLLTRFDEEVDAVFFENESFTFREREARDIILRRRKGPDGHAVIAPRIKQKLLDAVTAADGKPGEPLISQLAVADDPDLVRALLPFAGRLNARRAATVIATLAAHGLKKEARRHRALWAGRGRDFTVLGLRRFAKPSAKYVPHDRFDYAWNRMPTPLPADTYGRFVGADQSPPSADQLKRIRDAALFSLRTGTMAAADVLEHTRPAALTVALAAGESDDPERPGMRRAANDIRALIAERAAERFADDPKGWAQTITWVNYYQGTLPELLADPDSARDRSISQHFSSRLHTDLDAANVLLAIAPPDITRRALLTENMEATIADLAAGTPLRRVLVEHVLTRGTVPQRQRLAANEATPDSVLSRLLERSEKTDIAITVLHREEVGRDVRYIACTKARRGLPLKNWISDRAHDDPGAALLALSAKADHPDFILNVLRLTINDFDGGGRIAAYTLLADVVGLEAVWALELETTGNLEAMAPYVRATMATGDTVPLIEAAREHPFRSAEADEVPTSPSRTDESLDRQLDRPLEDLIRTRLDGRTDRWLELLDLLQARPEASDEELIAEFDVGTADRGGL